MERMRADLYAESIRVRDPCLPFSVILKNPQMPYGSAWGPESKSFLIHHPCLRDLSSQRGELRRNLRWEYFDKRLQMKSEISLTPEQADLCQAALSRDLVRVLSLLVCRKDEDGEDLTAQSQRELRRLSIRLQLMLLNFGMTSEELEAILIGYGTDSEY